MSKFGEYVQMVSDQYCVNVATGNDPVMENEKIVSDKKGTISHPSEDVNSVLEYFGIPNEKSLENGYSLRPQNHLVNDEFWAWIGSTPNE